jgi:RNA polymerase sigma factor (sigma-70 family)
MFTGFATCCNKKVFLISIWYGIVDLLKEGAYLIHINHRKVSLFKLRSIVSPDWQTMRQYKRLINGDRNAFDYFFQKSYKYIFYYCQYFVGNEYAENCTAGVFVSLWREKEFLNFSFGRDLEDQMDQYLFEGARAECFKQIRFNKSVNAEERVEELMKEAEFFRSLAIMRTLFEDRLNKKIAALPEFLKTIVKMAFFEHLSDKKIAKELKISEEYVHESKKKALEALELRKIVDKIQ